MSITPTEAADALRDIAASADHSRQLKGYEHAAPYFFLWGAIWIIGYGATGMSPRYGIIWLPLGLVGMAASFIIGLRQKRSHTISQRKFGVCMGLTWWVFIAFYAATLAVLQPHTPNQSGAFPALLMSAIYAGVGIWFLPRWLWLGIGIFTATLIGYFFLAPWFSFWMAAVGGGGLVLTGFWMRKV